MRNFLIINTMITLLILMLLPSLSYAATTDKYFACVSDDIAYPTEQYYATEQESIDACNAFAGGILTYKSSTTVTWSGGDVIRHRYTQAQLPTYDVYEYTCGDSLAIFDNVLFTCTLGSSLSTEDIGLLIGFMLGAFAFGFSGGYMFRVFYRATELL